MRWAITPARTLATSATGLARWLRTVVVGTQFHEGLVEHQRELRLAREPANKFDANAIAVQNNKHQCVGYIPRDVASQLAPVLDGGRVGAVPVAHHRSADLPPAAVIPLDVRLTAESPEAFSALLSSGLRLWPAPRGDLNSSLVADLVSPAAEPERRAAHDTLPVSKWPTQRVAVWVESLDLRRSFHDLFVDEDIDGELLLTLTEADLFNMGIDQLGDRRRLMRAIERLGAAPSPSPSPSPAGEPRPSFRLVKEFKFEAGHQLPKHDGKCRRPHGHSYIMQIALMGTALQESGPKTNMLVDFSSVSEVVKPIIEDYLDHHWLNDTLACPDPTAEVIAQWVYRKIKPDLPLLESVTIFETRTSRVEYREEGAQR